MSFDTELFITEIENRPCLWNSALEEYSDRNLKIKSWKEIVSIFQERDDMTKEEKNQLAIALQRRWKSIRGCFTREVGRQKKVMSGSDGGPRKNEYVFFQRLQFLKNVVSVKEPEFVAVTIKEEPAENSEPDIQLVQRDIPMEQRDIPMVQRDIPMEQRDIQMEQRDIPIVQRDIPMEQRDIQMEQRDVPIVQRKKRKRTRVSTCPEDDNNIIREAQNSTETRENLDATNDDEDRLFMLSLVGTLKKVPLHKKMATKIKIMSVLDHATNPPKNYRQSSRAQSQQIQPSPSNCHTGYATRSGSSETPHRCPVCQITPKILPLI